MTHYFNGLARVLHWLMALLILTMLFIGIGMVSTVSPRYYELLTVHRSIGIVVLVLAAVRLINRLLRPVPPLPADLPGWQRFAAQSSHLMLYVLMFALPLVGWAMLSAGGYPIVIFGSIPLPPIAPHGDQLFAVLRTSHSVLAFLLFAIILAHLAAALFHRLIRQDDVLKSMT
ncbi:MULTISPECIES: cytochrome b [Rhodomicrobium]|uniref:cytochrome b n=1 Tax=Rhodomicrobium TaxID=1068 RepID=UPI000B4B8329|nr:MULTISPECIES: cytochrome b [Rhodomicrobium]